MKVRKRGVVYLLAYSFAIWDKYDGTEGFFYP